MSTPRHELWEKIHRDSHPDEVSWHEPVPKLSLELVERAGVRPDCALVDVGGGVSHLADHLLHGSFGNITVLDIAASALDRAKQRLGANTENIHGLVADVLEHDLGGLVDLCRDARHGLLTV